MDIPRADSRQYSLGTSASRCQEITMAENWVAIHTIVGRSLLSKVPGQTEPARYAQDRALRVVRCVERLAPQADQRVERLDLAKVAALYAGVAQNLAGPGRGPDDDAYDSATELADDQLKDLLPPEDIELVGKILREQRKRDTTLPEAKILADAIALEEFGLIGLWNQSRQFHASGKTLEQLVKLWKAQHDYNYWEGRLRDGFHYEVARRAAKERLGQMNGIYERLQREHLGDDIGGSIMGHF
jgi:hypothetical protein